MKLLINFNDRIIYCLYNFIFFNGKMPSNKRHEYKNSRLLTPITLAPAGFKKNHSLNFIMGKREDAIHMLESALITMSVIAAKNFIPTPGTLGSPPGT